MPRGQLPRAYLRIDPNLDQHPDRDGMLALICAANRQIPRGRFVSRDILRRILGSSRRVDAFLNPRHDGKRPDIVLQPDGSYYLDGWDEWNEGDLTVGDRMARIRIRRNKAVTLPLQDRIADRNSPSEASRRLGVKANVKPSGAGAPGGSWAREACDDWIARYGGTAPGGRIGKALKPLFEKHAWVYVRYAWLYYLSQTDGRFANPQRFAETFGEWAGKAGPPPGNGDGAPPPKPRALERDDSPLTAEQMDAIRQRRIDGVDA